MLVCYLLNTEVMGGGGTASVLEINITTAKKDFLKSKLGYYLKWMHYLLNTSMQINTGTSCIISIRPAQLGTLQTFESQTT